MKIIVSLSCHWCLWSLQDLPELNIMNWEPQHNYLFSDWWNAIFFSVQKINLCKSQHTLHKINKAEHSGNNLHMFIYRRRLQWEGLRWKIGSEGFILERFALTLLFGSCCFLWKVLKCLLPLLYIWNLKSVLISFCKYQCNLSLRSSDPFKSMFKQASVYIWDQICMMWSGWKVPFRMLHLLFHLSMRQETDNVLTI